MSKMPSGCAGWIVAGLLGVGLVSQCGEDPLIPPPPEQMMAATSSIGTRIAFVQAARLNCRSSASIRSEVVARLDHGESVRVLETKAGWSRLDRNPHCWVSDTLLDTSPPPYRETTSTSVQRFSGGGSTFDGASEPRSSRRSGSSYYANCSAARAAGAAPVYADDPGYSRRLDRDGDGIGCES